MAADAVVLVPLELGLLAEPDPVPLAPLDIAGVFAALPVVLPLPLLPEPALADFNCTLPCASLQWVAADTSLEPDALGLVDESDWAEAASELPATNAVASNIAVNVFMVGTP